MQHFREIENAKFSRKKIMQKFREKIMGWQKLKQIASEIKFSSSDIY